MSASQQDIEIKLLDQALSLMPERTLFWREANTLVAADLHLGKAASFRAGAIPVPEGTTAETLTRLSAALTRTQAARLVILGDFWHARTGATEEIAESFESFTHRHAQCEMLLLPGNHDRFASTGLRGAFPALHHAAHVLLPPFLFTHHPRSDMENFIVAGHLHPAVELRGRGRLKHRASCFWLQQRMLVLPAFGSFTGNSYITPARGDSVFIVSEEAVHKIS